MNRFRHLMVPLAIALIVTVSRPASAQESLTYADLVRRLTDLEQLAVLPLPGETCRQWSSWDRKSQYDAAAGKYVNWSANGDGTGVIRQEGDQVVMAEMEGPGCIWRTWSARAEDGHVKIYLDGGERPAVDLPFKSYFSGDTAPFNYRQLSYNLQDQGCKGQNLYFPIPYQKSCKIVADKGWGRYYQFVYTTFPKGTKVPTFSLSLAQEPAIAELLQETDRRLAEQSDQTVERSSQKSMEATIRISAGQREQLARIEGPRAITAIRVKGMRFKDREDEMAALRRLCLQITWDGQAGPAVWCPLGDFFGTAPGVNLYRTLPTGMTKDGFYANWYMPFEKNALVELVNEDRVTREASIEIVHAPLARPFNKLGYFHCKWHRDTVTLPEDRWPDWTLLRAEGRGRYCGVMLHVWNPQGGWWGEGDEKFFIDGEKYPSTFGTGSEDYFGYAWCDPHLFQRFSHAQTMTMQNRGHQSVLRWQIADSVPFQKSFEGCIEKYYKTEEKGTQYAATVVWYLAPGGGDPYGPVPVAQRDGYYENKPLLAGGFKILNNPRGRLQTQTMNRPSYRGTWDQNDQLWWTGAKPGDKLELAMPVANSGKYRVKVVLTQARDYGIVQFYLDGQKAGSPIDLYNPRVTRIGPIALGDFQLTAGDHPLAVEIVGANAKALPQYMFGLDQVLLEPVD